LAQLYFRLPTAPFDTLGLGFSRERKTFHYKKLVFKVPVDRKPLNTLVKVERKPLNTLVKNTQKTPEYIG